MTLSDMYTPTIHRHLILQLPLPVIFHTPTIHTSNVLFSQYIVIVIHFSQSHNTFRNASQSHKTLSELSHSAKTLSIISHCKKNTVKNVSHSQYNKNYSQKYLTHNTVINVTLLQYTVSNVKLSQHSKNVSITIYCQ